MLLLDGQALIAKALSGFDKAKAQLQAGIDKCSVEVTENRGVIFDLEERNDELGDSMVKASNAIRGIDKLLSGDDEVAF